MPGGIEHLKDRGPKLEVRSVGALVTRMLPHDVQGGCEPSLNVRLFAKLSNGLLVIDRASGSFTTPFDPGQPGDYRRKVEHGLAVFSSIENPAHHVWRGVADELRESYGLDVDTDELARLPVDLVLDSDTRAAVENPTDSDTPA